MEGRKWREYAKEKKKSLRVLTSIQYIGCQSEGDVGVQDPGEWPGFCRRGWGWGILGFASLALPGETLRARGRKPASAVFDFLRRCVSALPAGVRGKTAPPWMPFFVNRKSAASSESIDKEWLIRKALEILSDIIKLIGRLVWGCLFVPTFLPCDVVAEAGLQLIFQLPLSKNKGVGFQWFSFL